MMDRKLSLEYRDVALRAEQLAASKTSKAEVLELIEAVEGFAESVEIVRKLRPAAARRFGITVLTPAKMLRRMRKGEQDAE